MPLLTGLEARAIAPAATGRAETSREFSKRIKCVKLIVPSESNQEGGEDRNIAVPTPTQARNANANASQPNQAGAQHIDVDRDFANHAEEARSEVAKIATRTDPSVADATAGSDSSLLEYIGDHEAISLEDAIRNKYSEDAFFKDILHRPKEYKNFLIDKGLIYLQLQDILVLCVPDVIVNERSVREIAISNAHVLLAHLGPQKTLDLLRDHVWWR
ncbi:hypothetical protein OE88DRAFT_1632633, partial [Heliocybe sulcata]